MSKIVPFIPGSCEADDHYLVVAKEWGLTPLCTVPWKIVGRTVGAHVCESAHTHAVCMFTRSISDPGELCVFLYNPRTGGYIPGTFHTSSQTLTVGLLQNYPWINSAEEPSQMENFLLALGVPEAKLNRKFADWEMRRTGTREIPLPEYNC